MVCMDGFVLTHAVEEIDVPDQETVDAVLPAFVPRQYLDPEEPVTIGAMVGPEAFTEVKYLMALEQLRALDEIPLDQRRLRERGRPQLRRAPPRVPHGGRRDRGGRDGIGPRLHRGRRRRPEGASASASAWSA